jgi:uncharacterized protein YtpQ (UPF0354 family)
MTKSKERIFPRLTAEIPDDGSPAIKVSSDDAPVLKKVLADLVLLYAFDMGDHFEWVARRDLKVLGISEAELHAVAIDNLRALNLEIGAKRAERVMMLTAGGDYEATLLLLPDVWKSVGGMVEGAVIVGVPARDVLYVAGDSKPESLADLEAYTTHSLSKVDKPLSRHLLKWTGTSWESIKAIKK